MGNEVGSVRVRTTCAQKRFEFVQVTSCVFLVSVDAIKFQIDSEQCTNYAAQKYDLQSVNTSTQ